MHALSKKMALSALCVGICVATSPPLAIAADPAPKIAFAFNSADISAMNCAFCSGVFVSAVIVTSTWAAASPGAVRGCVPMIQ